MIASSRRVRKPNGTTGFNSTSSLSQGLPRIGGPAGPEDTGSRVRHRSVRPMTHGDLVPTILRVRFFRGRGADGPRPHRARRLLFRRRCRRAQSYEQPYDTIVCLEVLEHIERDLDVIANWKSGCECICSVPNFDYPTHVRWFRHEAEIVSRYGHLISIREIERIPCPLDPGQGVEGLSAATALEPERSAASYGSAGLQELRQFRRMVSLLRHTTMSIICPIRAPFRRGAAPASRTARRG